MTLYQITLAINFIALVASVWLGLYLVTRNPRVPTAWLTALTLWSLSGLFINVLLALNPPPDPAFRPSSLRFLFPFWPTGSPDQGPSTWLQGWSVAPSIAFWHHATLLMRPGKMNIWRWSRVIIGYLSAIAAIEVQAFTSIFFSVARNARALPFAIASTDARKSAAVPSALSTSSSSTKKLRRCPP